MDITDLFVLPEGVVLMKCNDLTEEMRKQADCSEEDYLVTRPGARTPSRVVDKYAADLLEMFKSPLPIVDAVINYSSERKLDAEAMLVEAYPLLQGFIQARFLVPADSDDVGKIGSSFLPGQEVMNIEIIRILQILEDVELYQVRTGEGKVAALKITRRASDDSLSKQLEHEARLLRHLDGEIGPALIQAGSYNGRQYLLMDWCYGVDASVAAEELRREGRTTELLSLCVRVLETYTSLHAKGLIHGDVHPRNTIVSGTSDIKVVDYGLAQARLAEKEILWQGTGGIGFFFEPEYVEALREGRTPSLPTFVGEQYALAALVYFLFTGAQYLNFSLEREEMLRQIANEKPLTFAQQGVSSWPEVERVLQQALRKHPSERFASVAEFARRLETASIATQRVSGDTAGVSPPIEQAASPLLSETLKQVDPGETLFATGVTTAPTCSMNLGATGIAYALYRMASVGEDSKLLSDADLWITRTLSASGKNEAFTNAKIEITDKTVGRISPYHTLSGLFAVQALISHATGNLASQQESVEAFVKASREDCDSVDLTLGRSGSLLIGALLLDIMGRDSLLNSRSLLELGNSTMTRMKHELHGWVATENSPPNQYLGVAHGLAGCLYAMMRWCQSSGNPLPDIVIERLHRLSQHAEPIGRGARWKWVSSKSGAIQYMPGWCHGSAGYVFLWTQAYERLQDEEFLLLAEQAAWNAWEEPKGNIPNLCCGLAGRAYSLLNLYKLTGQQDWLRRAKRLASAATDLGKLPEYPAESLYKGDLGVALLMFDLERPETSAMPFFEREYT